ncbi:AMP-binding protein [Streptomyces sp. NBC_00878]|uniref:AMP-binding protein n=1 Tax=Streptomyces sp. NBC_00878 TaxID=2975854 RepID=UPI002255BEB7|nr:AMP-binding protein [Streptomyces sp. NBC_00878]MCX4903237.1 AMP-binding protein [Streptomyces sp. NBC_00878]
MRSHQVEPPLETHFVHILQKRADDDPNALAFTFLEGDLDVVGTLTYGELRDRSRALAARLLRTVSPGDRVLLLHPAGLDYVVAFYACLYARVIAVPLYVPQHRTVSTVEAIARDCAAAAVLTTERGTRRKSLFGADSRSANLPWLATDAAPVTDAPLPTDAQPAADAPLDGVTPLDTDGIAADTIAYLQYTSGSTSVPKGVIVDHTNAVRQCAEAALSWQVDGDSRWVSWLPHFHDYGQIGSVLLPVFAGAQCVLLAPTTFVRRPIRWLRAISRYRGTHTGAPNFAYDLCVEGTTEDERAGLDLSSLITAGNGAEPVQFDTQQRFERMFAEYGLRPDVLCPSYGLAEATLKVTNKTPGEPLAWGTFGTVTPGSPVVELTADKAVRPLVACGTTVADTRVAIVDPKTGHRLPDGHAGEIWVSGPIIARGYWGRPAESTETFRARLRGDGADSHLRTGDLGFFHDGQLYICGRIKDVVIINGVNHYPQDIERTVEDSHPAVRRGHSAAFGVSEGAQESVVVVAECARRDESSPEAVALAIRDAVWRSHELAVTVVVAETGTVPVTTSGKIQRTRCKAGFIEGHLDVRARVEAAPVRSGAKTSDKTSDRTSDRTSDETSTPAERPVLTSAAQVLHQSCRAHIEGWIAGRVLEGTGTVDAREPLSAYGLSSVHMLELHQTLEDWAGVRLPPEWIWEAGSIEELATLVVERLTTSAADLTSGAGR